MPLFIFLRIASLTMNHLMAVPIHITKKHYNDVIMGAIESRITSLRIVYPTVYSDADQRKHQSSASLAFVWGIHRGPVNSPHKWPVTPKMFPFDDVVMILQPIDKLIKKWPKQNSTKRQRYIYSVRCTLRRTHEIQCYLVEYNQLRTLTCMPRICWHAKITNLKHEIKWSGSWIARTFACYNPCQHPCQNFRTWLLID